MKKYHLVLLVFVILIPFFLLGTAVSQELDRFDRAIIGHEMLSTIGEEVSFERYALEVSAAFTIAHDLTELSRGGILGIFALNDPALPDARNSFLHGAIYTTEDTLFQLSRFSASFDPYLGSPDQQLAASVLQELRFHMGEGFVLEGIDLEYEMSLRDKTITYQDDGQSKVIQFEAKMLEALAIVKSMISYGFEVQQTDVDSTRIQIMAQAMLKDVEQLPQKSRDLNEFLWGLEAEMMEEIVSRQTLIEKLQAKKELGHVFLKILEILIPEIRPHHTPLSLAAKKGPAHLLAWLKGSRPILQILENWSASKRGKSQGARTIYSRPNIYEKPVESDDPTRASLGEVAPSQQLPQTLKAPGEEFRFLTPRELSRLTSEERARYFEAMARYVNLREASRTKGK